MGSPLRAFCRLVAYLSLTFALIPVQALFLTVGSRRAKTLPTTFHRLCCGILGLKLEIRGKRVSHGPTLFIANHTSYLDITVLGAATHGSFVSKAEVKETLLQYDRTNHPLRHPDQGAYGRTDR